MHTTRIGTGSPLGRRERAALAEFPLDKMSPGFVLLWQDTVPESAFVLLEGILKLIHRLPDARSTVVALRGAGFLFGAESALARRPHPASVVAVTSCRVRRIPRRRFADVTGSGGALASWFLASRTVEQERQVHEAAALARLDARERLESYFEFVRTELGGTTAAGAVIPLPLRDWELAQLLAITPSYLSRLLQEQQAHGRIVRQTRRSAGLRADDGAGRT